MPPTVQSFLRRLKRSRAIDRQKELQPEPSSTSRDQEQHDLARGAEPGVSLPGRSELGLALLWEPDNPVNDQQNCVIDIVFVHGLNGDIVGTWTHSNGTCWPKDLLPDSFPNARIFSYGYDSKVFFSRSQSEYRDFALGLLNDLHHLEQNTGRALPIIFICHSLGGIVVKEAINVASERDWSRHVVDRSKGIVFLGTPHRGSSVAGTATLLSNLIEAVWSPAGFVMPGPRKNLVRDLQQNSKVLFATSDRFLGKANSIEIASFYENSQMMPLRRVVVDENSAILGLPHEKRWPMFANHCDLCRFPDAQSRDYQSVVNVIREMMRSILASQVDSKSDRSFTNSEQVCMQRLATVDIIEFESQIDAHLPNTLSWLSQDVHYNNWMSESSVRLLLVTGHAGCGKTVLSSYLRVLLSNQAQSTSSVCRFYCDAKVEEMNSAVELMRSMIYQAAQHSYKARRATVEAAKHDHWLWGSFERLWTLFETIATAGWSTGITIIIDAIDELEDRTQKSICRKILQLLDMDTAGSLKFVITSQPHAFAVKELESRSSHLALEGKQDVIGEDVNLYIRDRLAKLQSLKGWSDGMCQRLMETLQKKADRSFLWVSFTLSYLEGRDILDKTDLDDALSQIPPDLTKFYRRFLTSVLSRDAPGPALRLLNLVLSSSRPLHVDELAILLSITNSHRSIAEVQRDYTIRGIQSIEQVLGPLVKSSNSKIQLVHTSLKDHLDAFGSDYGIDEVKGHSILAERCMLYLSLLHRGQSSIESFSSSTQLASPKMVSPARYIEQVEDPDAEMLEGMFGAMFDEPGVLPGSISQPLRPGNELHDYAIRFWAMHLEQSNPAKDTSLHAVAVEMYAKTETGRWKEYILAAAGEVDEYPTRPDVLSIACFFGHSTLLNHFLSTKQISAAQIGNAMYWASSRGHISCVKLLRPYIASEWDKSIYAVSGRSPLAVAALNGQVDVLSFLLEADIFDINSQDEKGSTALASAATRAEEQTVSVLLKLAPSRNLDINLADVNGRSPLFWACSTSSESLVYILLHDPRTDLNLLDRRGRSALSWACQDGFGHVVKMFVDNPRSNLSSQDESGNTALLYAVKSKDFDTVNALFRRVRRKRLSSPVSDLVITAKDSEGRNAISWAATASDPRILGLLLRHAPSEANAQDNHGWPPIAWTLDPPGYPQNALQLLPHCGDYIHNTDDEGSSLLSTAIMWRQSGIAKILIETTDIDVNSRNSAGRTALSLAASAGSLDTVELLITARGADPSIPDNLGRLPLHWVQVHRHKEIADYLEELTPAIAGAQR